MNLIRLIVIGAVACSAAAQPARAEGALAWTDAVREARANHPELVSAFEAVRRAEAVRTQTAAALWPQVSASVEGGRSSSQSIRTDSYRYGIAGSQLLFDGFQTHFEAQAADRAVEAAREDYAGASADVRFRLRTAFTNLLKAQELLSITERIADRRRQSRDVVRLRYDAGREHKGSLLTAEANSAQAEFEVGQARRAIAVAQRRLSKELGRTHAASVSAEGSLDSPPAADVPAQPDFEDMARATPAVRAFSALTEAAAWDVRSAWAGFFPAVSADVASGRRGSAWMPHGEEWSAGVSFSVPLFEGGSLVAGVARANASLAQARADEKNALDSQILTLESAWNDLQDASGQLAVQEKFLEAARERNRIAESEYSTGLVTFNDWIIIEDNLVKTEKSYLDAKARVIDAAAAWDQARGAKLDEN